VLSERKVSVGDTAAVGKELAKVIDPRSMRFDGQVSADRMHEVKPGQSVSFRVNGPAPNTFNGRVKRVDATANASTRQVEVQVVFNDPNDAPRVAGLFAEGVVEAAGATALMLPEGALLRKGDAVFVWKLEAQRIVQQPLKLGARDARSGQWPVLQGLAAGDRVLRSPGSQVRNGQAFEWVQPVAAATVPAAAASR
jgi:membrane fusion protein, multidrug efflux system